MFNSKPKQKPCLKHDRKTCRSLRIQACSGVCIGGIARCNISFCVCRSLCSIRVAYPELVYKGLMALQSAELYIKSFTGCQEARGLCEVDSAIAMFTQYQSTNYKMKRDKLAPRFAAVGFHQSWITLQALVQAQQLKTKIIAQLQRQGLAVTRGHTE